MVRRGQLGRARIWLSFAMAVLLDSSTLAIAQEAELEYVIKATFLYKFVPFVEWPVSAFETTVSPFTICLFGSDPVVDVVDDVVRGRRLGERPIAVLHLRTVRRDSGCHLLYVARSRSQTMAAAVRAVRGEPVLTVVDDPGSDGTGGMIRFVVEANKVRFDIDAAAAAESGLAISSGLLGLARYVRLPERR